MFPQPLRPTVFAIDRVAPVAHREPDRSHPLGQVAGSVGVKPTGSYTTTAYLTGTRCFVESLSWQQRGQQGNGEPLAGL
jgi:hypothetical protein